MARTALNAAHIAARESVVQVLVSWRGEPLLARTVERGQSLWLGNRPGDLPIPLVTTNRARFRLVAFDRPSPVLSVPGGTERGQQAELVGADTVNLEVGEFSLEVSWVGVDPALRRRARLATEPARYAAAVAFVLLSILGAIAHGLSSLGLTDVAGIERALSLRVGAPVSGRAEPESTTPAPFYVAALPTDYLIPTNGDMKCGSNTMGRPEAVSDKGRYVVQGPKDNPDPHVASTRGDVPAELELQEQAAQRVGGDDKAVTFPWAREDALGLDDAPSARGRMWGDPIEDAEGNNGGGIQLVEGGLAKRLHWATEESAQRVPRVLHTGLRVRGPLRPSAVTRAVATRFDRFHACYARARETAPALAGRMELRFEVGTDGRVAAASVGNSTISDLELTSCLTASVRDLMLPAVEAGSSAVIYPLFFESGSGESTNSRIARGAPPRAMPTSCCSR
jgi:hypothetical protein